MRVCGVSRRGKVSLYTLGRFAVSVNLDNITGTVSATCFFFAGLGMILVGIVYYVHSLELKFE